MGIKSGMSYNGAHNLTELRENVKLVRITQSGSKESGVHGITKIWAFFDTNRKKNHSSQKLDFKSINKPININFCFTKKIKSLILKISLKKNITKSLHLIVLKIVVLIIT